jgi:CBS domain-containing protein
MAQQIRELMTPNPVALPGTASVHEAARAMRDADIGNVIIIENNQVSGIVTDRDIVVRLVAEARDPATTTLADLCSHALVTVTPTDSIEQAVRLMRTHAIRRLPVVEGGQPVGMVSLGDLAVEEDPGSALAETVVRYTDIACPRQVWIETLRVTVVVRLTVQHPAYSDAMKELKLDPNQPVRVGLQAPGFNVLGKSVQEVPIPRDTDSDPVVFDLQPKQVGHTSLTFDFFQGNQPVGTTSVAVEVTAYEIVAGADSRPAQPLHFGGQVEPPDIVLHIAVQESPPALVFTLIRDGGAWWRTFPPVGINARSEAHAGELYRSIASLVETNDPVVDAVLGKRLGIPAEDVDRRIRQLGQNLWKNLIPQELKDLYSGERRQWKDTRLLILSDEPHLPWELIWPYDEAGQWKDEGPWCDTLNMTRWLRKDPRGNGNVIPPNQLHLHSLAVLAPTYSLLSNLVGAQAEQDVLLGMVVQHNLQNVSPAKPTWGAVMDLLESGGYDWVHAAAHGNFYAQGPDADSALWLQQDQSLTPEAIVGPEIEGYLRHRRPAFFFNACQVGRQGWTLTRIGGWANRLVSAGAGLFVGPLWEVSDSGALKFASAFYQALFDGATVAGATRQARLAAREMGDPSWLAYSVYAHPNARLVRGSVLLRIIG